MYHGNLDPRVDKLQEMPVFQMCGFNDQPWCRKRDALYREGNTHKILGIRGGTELDGLVE